MLPTRLAKSPYVSGLAVGMGLFFAGHFEYVLAVEFDAASADRAFADINHICLGWGFPLHEALATIAEVSRKSVIQKTK
jgi:hypothetical protein